MCREIVENGLSGTKAGFKAILNLVFNQKAERKKMDHQKSKSTFRATLPALILGLIVLWTGLAAVAAEKKYVTDPSTGKVVSAPEYGGTITAWAGAGWTKAPSDPYFGSWPHVILSGVNEKLGIPNWAIDRDVWDLTAAYYPLSVMTGRLAESWETPDPLTYVFNIRKGVHWHKKAPMNGRLLTAQDVEWNYHRMLGLGEFTDAGPTAFAAQVTGIPFESVTATDDSTVVMKLKEPFLDALGIMLGHNSTFIVPREVIEQYGDMQDWRNVVGTGPFELTEVVDGSSFTYVKNPDYWGFDEKYPENRLPYVDEVRVLAMGEEATIMAALRSGKLDYIHYLINLDGVLSLKRTNPEIAVHTILFRSQNSFAPNLRVPPFDDINVRRAMQMALDNETAVATFWKGEADSTPFGWQGVKGYHIPFEEWDEEVKQYYRYDPEAAEKLLDEAGYPRGADGTRFKTVLSQSQYHVLDFSEIAVAYWAEIGVDVEIEVLTNAEFQEMSGRTNKGMISSIGGSLYDPVAYVGHLRSDSTWNRWLHQWPELDAMVDAALAANTIEEQQRHIVEADMYVIEKHWQIWGPRSPTFMVAQPWLTGYSGEIGHWAVGDQWTTHSRLWIDSELKKEMGH